MEFRKNRARYYLFNKNNEIMINRKCKTETECKRRSLKTINKSVIISWERLEELGFFIKPLDVYGSEFDYREKL